ncbi:uncharacterized protein LOC143921156 [Arctopsyche grandis]|uniref:uncharacterized protein LOC143921156 n=1 Tax=Arctopsyche grandis TaxID=121162 RepID=UPI00406DA4DF
MDSINLYYQNVRGLRTKTDIFLRNINMSNYDIILLTETWLIDTISDEKLFDERYIVWRRDRNYVRLNQKRGGGCLVATKRELGVVPRPEWHSSVEDMWISLTLRNITNHRNLLKFHVCVLYLCSENIGNSFNTQLTNFLENMSTISTNYPDDRFLIVGDFNLSNIQWSQDISRGGLMPINSLRSTEMTLIDALHFCNFKQYNGVLNLFGRILDLVLSNEHLVVDACLDPLVPEDPYHKSLLITADLTIYRSLRSKPYTRFLFDLGNYNEIQNELNSVSWSYLHTVSFDDAVNSFYKLIYNLIYPTETCSK